MARMAADAIFDAKGREIVLLDVEELFLLSDVFVIATGTSRPHVQALAEKVEEKLSAEMNIKPIRVEGQTEAEWVLVDYGFIIVHLFQESARDFYSLERLWGDSEEVRWDEPVVSDEAVPSDG